MQIRENFLCYPIRFDSSIVPKMRISQVRFSKSANGFLPLNRPLRREYPFTRTKKRDYIKKILFLKRLKKISRQPLEKSVDCFVISQASIVSAPLSGDEKSKGVI